MQCVAHPDRDAQPAQRNEPKAVTADAARQPKAKDREVDAAAFCSYSTVHPKGLQIAEVGLVPYVIEFIFYAPADRTCA